MEFYIMRPGHPRWRELRDFAAACSWGAGKALAAMMDEERFEDWECVAAAFEDGKPAGFCTPAKRDCLPDVDYTPWIGFVFVAEAYRGKRLSEKLIDYASAYLREQGFDRVYICTDHINLYEKYGFKAIDSRPAPWNPEETEKILTRPV